jgi:DNA-binding NarL/FixJ family response regulator
LPPNLPPNLPAMHGFSDPGAVLVVDDDAPMRERLRRILEECGTPPDSIQVAGDIAQAHRLLREGEFRLALVDIGLPDGSGIDLIAHLFDAHPRAASVVISAFGAEDLILAALRAGAVGYLLKEREDIEIALSLRSIAAGGAPIDPFIARRILSLLAAAAPGEAPAAQAVASPLSQREHQVLQLVAQGRSNGEIADAMSLSRLTVESHTKNIYRKLVVGSRTEAVHRARQMGWLP